MVEGIRRKEIQMSKIHMVVFSLSELMYWTFCEILLICCTCSGLAKKELSIFFKKCMINSSPLLLSTKFASKSELIILIDRGRDFSLKWNVLSLLFSCPLFKVTPYNAKSAVASKSYLLKMPERWWKMLSCYLLGRFQKEDIWVSMLEICIEL